MIGGRVLLKAALIAALLSQGSALALAAPTAKEKELVPKNIPRVVLDRVEILGVTIFSQAEIEASLEVSPGDMLERPKVMRTAENLITQFRSRGYEQVQVKGELTREAVDAVSTEVVLRFAIIEGKPTRISNVSMDMKRSSLTKPQLTRELRSRVADLEGEIFDQEKVSSVRRALQEVLVSQEYVGARVEEVEVTSTSGGKLKAGTRGETGRWVNLRFQIDPGEKAKFGFRGNTIFTRGELIDFISDQRIIGFGRNYVASIEKRLIEEYQNRGFTQAKVSSYTFELPEQNERRVTFVIEEGERFAVDSIDFEGNIHFRDDDLEDQYFGQAPALLQRKIYVEKEVQGASELLLEWMKSEGYLSSKLISVSRNFVPNTNRVRLTVYLYEGDQTRLESVLVLGNKAFTQKEIEGILKLRAGKPLNLYALSEGLEELKAEYRAKGHYDFKIVNEEGDKVVQYSADQRSALVELELDEGPAYRLSRIQVEGLKDTKNFVVIREIELKPGDVLSEPIVQTAELKLKRLGIFSQVSIKLVDDVGSPDRKILHVTVQEGSPGLLAGGPGYRQDLGIRAFGQVGYNNMRGRNEELALSVNANYREWGGIFCNDADHGNCFPEFQAQLTYGMPWFLNSPTSFKPKLAIARTRFVKFDVGTVSASLSWERSLWARIGLSGSIMYSLERTEQFNTKTSPDALTLTIGSITPTLKIDRRDNPLAPTRGWLVTSSLELADPRFGSQSDPFPVGYYRFQFRGDLHVPVSRNVQWYLSFRTGYGRNNYKPPAGTSLADSLNYAIPLSKQFALGGVASIRGFQEQELNLQNDAIRGTMSYVNYRTQLDLPFAGGLRFGPFLDAGNLLKDRYLLGALQFGTGLGFHYLSPVGPINFDWGFKVQQNPSARFYFSIGFL